jgi:hypothetical protein
LAAARETVAGAQRHRLVGAAKRGERFGRDPGRILGPGVTWSKYLFVGGERSFAKRESFARVAGREQQPS